jgi:hypothetical protein
MFSVQPPPLLDRDMSDSLSITSGTSNGSNFSHAIIALANDPIGTTAAAGGAAVPCMARMVRGAVSAAGRVLTNQVSYDPTSDFFYDWIGQTDGDKSVCSSTRHRAR